MLVFLVHFINFFYFLKCPKSKKNGKISKNLHFPLCSATLFLTFVLYTICFVFFKSYLKIKTQKNMKKIYFKLFFKNENWTFIFVHFLFFKKSFKKVKRFSIFFQSPKIAFLVFQIWKCLFLEDVLEYFAIYWFKKNERFCYLFADEK